jgi:predicted pyridoxine 5'-phosphate oxidase superfamily flavin-nucleotide-binding protein
MARSNVAPHGTSLSDHGPFHPGEIEAQRLAGGGAAGGGIGDFMTLRHRTFFGSLPFVAVASMDAEGPVATLLAGMPGFVSVPDAHTLRIQADLDGSDPTHRALVATAQVGLLGIELATRRRNRVNGVIRVADQHGFEVAVRQSFGNCRKYIHVRDVQPGMAAHEPAEVIDALDPDAREAIRRADTFFVASAARTDEPRGGVDISHRGGPAGFVRVHQDTLTIPDYSGNRYFNTLGNLVSDARAALLFVDFERGDLLHLQGTTEIVWHGPEVQEWIGAERLWRLHVRRAWRRRQALPLRWTPPAARRAP